MPSLARCRAPWLSQGSIGRRWLRAPGDSRGEAAMLIKLLRTYLRPYTSALIAVVALQLVSPVANLYLPSLNADIIDKRGAKGDSAYIISTRGWMLALTPVQIACSIAAAYFGARA